MQGSSDWDGDEMFLFSETGFNLTIQPDGEVFGTQKDDPLGRLQISSAGVSLVRIRGVESQLYLCFDSGGKLYGEVDPNVEATVFEEKFQGCSYTGYKSKVYPDWYIGIEKSGVAKNGTKTGWGQKEVKFLPRKKNFCS